MRAKTRKCEVIEPRKVQQAEADALGSAAGSSVKDDKPVRALPPGSKSLASMEVVCAYLGDLTVSSREVGKSKA